MSERTKLLEELKTAQSELYSLENRGLNLRSRYNSYPNKYEIADEILKKIGLLALFFLIGFLVAYIIMKETRKR